MTRPQSTSHNHALRLNGWASGPFNTFVTVIALLAFGSTGAIAQSDFHMSQIVWVVIGEASTASPKNPIRAGQHLFMANELADFTLRHVEVARIEAQPEVVELSVGQRFCVTSLRLAAFNAGGHAIQGSPMSISVRQDHKEALGLDRSRKNICVKGTSAGEFPIRFASLLPAKDGTTRGAQVFVRIREAATHHE